MTLYEWVKDIVKDGVELFTDEITITNDKGVRITRNTKVLREISLGIISTNNSKEWYRLCRLNCPVGTIIEEYEDVKWNDLYEDTATLVRNRLTKELIKERNNKSATTLLSILERRDKDRWKKDEKQTSVKATTSQGINLEFSIV